MSRILVVDDDAMNRMLAERLLKKGGYEVATVDSGQACLDFLAAETVDVVLLDMLMPDMDGLETFAKMRDDAKMCALPVIFLTGSSEDEHLQAARDAGASGYVTKPFKPQELYAAIESILNEQ